MKKGTVKHKKNALQRSLDVIERIGNKLPDPFIIFVLLATTMIILSFIFNLTNASVTHPGTGEDTPIRSLLSGEGLEFILTSVLDNFTGFAPLGMVLVMMLGIGLAEKVGLLSYAVRKVVFKTPSAFITYAIVFVGILGNIASDAAAVIIPPLGALIYYKIGRHPLVGLAAGFAGAGAGFTANFFITGADALLSGISTESAAIVSDSITVTPVDNWYFNIVSVIALTIVGGLVTSKFVEPRLGKYKHDEVKVDDEGNEELPNANKGFINATIAALVFIASIVITLMLPNSPLLGENGNVIDSPFMAGIVPFTFLFFVIVGVTFGLTVGKIKSSKDVSYYMGESIKDMSGFIVLAFAIGQFIAYFKWSNLGTWLAVNGAEFLQSVNFTGFGLIIGYIIFTALLNLVITSGSAKWAIEGPIFIPMFMQLGYHPAFTQVAYRVADSSMNVVTPLYPYMIVILGFIQKYDKKANIGTYISLMLPYSITFLITWVILIAIFYFTGLPYGPGVHTFM